MNIYVWIFFIFKIEEGETIIDNYFKWDLNISFEVIVKLLPVRWYLWTYVCRMMPHENMFEYKNELKNNKFDTVYMWFK
jgi:hypothetical protein